MKKPKKAQIMLTTATPTHAFDNNNAETRTASLAVTQSSRSNEHVGGGGSTARDHPGKATRHYWHPVYPRQKGFGTRRIHASSSTHHTHVSVNYNFMYHQINETWCTFSHSFCVAKAVFKSWHFPLSTSSPITTSPADLACRTFFLLVSKSLHAVNSVVAVSVAVGISHFF